ncbi:MAG: hypothetical protein ACRCTD_11165, partial [Beijerinckiaceae bacterium]
VNGRNVSSCSTDGAAFRGVVDFATYTSFTSCTASFAACNNVFHVKNGTVVSYTPIGTGGSRCFTDERTRPGFRGPTNF